MSTIHWVIVLVVVLLVFGTKRLTSGARDVGRAVNEFKKGMQGDEDASPAQIEDARVVQDTHTVREDERNPR